MMIVSKNAVLAAALIPLAGCSLFKGDHDFARKGKAPVNLIVSGSGSESLRAEPNEKITWKADNPEDKLQLLFPQGAPCKIDKGATTAIPVPAVHEFTCEIDSISEVSLSYQIILQSGGDFPDQVTDCRPCSLVAGSGSHTSPGTPSNTPSPKKEKAKSHDSSDPVEFFCDGTKPVFKEPSTSDVSLGDLPVIKVWKGYGDVGTWHVRFRNSSPCAEKLDIYSDKTKPHKCTIDKQYVTDLKAMRYEYDLYASSGACGNNLKPVPGTINVTGAVAPKQ